MGGGPQSSGPEWLCVVVTPGGKATGSPVEVAQLPVVGVRLFFIPEAGTQVCCAQLPPPPRPRPLTLELWNRGLALLGECGPRKAKVSSEI